MQLVLSEQLTLTTVIAKLTGDPARLIKDDKLGTLSIGAPADITIFDLYKGWTVDTKTFASRGKNTPLAGSVLKGKVMATVYGGKLVYKDDAIKLEEG